MKNPAGSGSSQAAWPGGMEIRGEVFGEGRQVPRAPSWNRKERLLPGSDWKELLGGWFLRGLFFVTAFVGGVSGGLLSLLLCELGLGGSA